MPNFAHIVPTVLLSLGSVFAQAALEVQSFPLKDASQLVMAGKVKAEAATYKDRQAVRLDYDGFNDGFAVLPFKDFQDGIIEADVALKVGPAPRFRDPGFIGIAFRAKPDASRYELFYVRPGNAISDDQAMRNHSAQYVSPPNFEWYRLRHEWPWVYETHASIEPEAWTHLKIEVAGRNARLQVNGAPTLFVDGLKGEDLRGAVALWGYGGQESYFSNVRITPTAPQNVKNGSEASGTWDVKFFSDAGPMNGVLKVNRKAAKLIGAWTGALGQNRPVEGIWRDGYVELSFPGEWPKQNGEANQAHVTAFLAGWIDGNSGKGRMRVEGHSDGRWEATRKE